MSQEWGHGFWKGRTQGFNEGVYFFRRYKWELFKVWIYTQVCGRWWRFRHRHDVVGPWWRMR
jgi:hypothetical protein